MPKAIVIDQPGGPEALQWRDVPKPQPVGSELLIRHTAVGLNYIDVYHRSGLYPLASYPATLGLEGAGVIEQCGPECQYFKAGDRVAYAGGPLGAYAQYRTIPERFVVKIPDGLDDALAAGVMVKGLTASYLVRHTFEVDKKTTLLVHAAAGGVGLILCQWAKHLGARVIGTVGSPEKAALAKEHGCEFPIDYTKEDVVARVREITEGRGCNVVYDSVGQATFMRSLDCLMPFGLMVSYGQASGKVAPFDLHELQKRGSLYLTRPSLMDYIQDHAEYIASAGQLMQLVMKGIIKIPIRQTYYLRDAVSAHRDLEARRTSGSTVFFPE